MSCVVLLLLTSIKTVYCGWNPHIGSSQITAIRWSRRGGHRRRGGASAGWCWSIGASTDPCVLANRMQIHIIRDRTSFQRLFSWLEIGICIIILPEPTDTDGDDGEEVSETSDDDDKHNVRDLNNLRPRQHYLHLLWQSDLARRCDHRMLSKWHQRSLQ